MNGWLEACEGELFGMWNRNASNEALKQIKKDEVPKREAEYQEDPRPSLITYGPRTRREFLDLLRLRGDHPA